uniref:Rhodanese domain-containing protein n=1 Tax=Desulfobacca acetoxidans TaxID=60893 RepID=A0A7C3ZDD9_9BACT
MFNLKHNYWWLILTGLTAVFFLVGGTMGPAAAEGPEEEKAAKEMEEKPDRPQLNSSVDILSQYVFRGVALSRGSVVFQPSMTVSFKGVAVNIWGNFDTNENNPFGITKPRRNAAKWNETDLTLSYSKEVIRNLTLTGGIVYYGLDSNNSLYDSFEVYGGFDYKFPWFNAGFAAYREVANLPGWYLSWYITRSFDLPVKLPKPLGKPTLDLWASWSAELSNSRIAYPTADGSLYRSLHAGHLMATLNIPVGTYVKISPKIMYWYALGGQSTYTSGTLSWDGNHNHILGGVNASFSF